ncbi:hypothetical protein FA13DRAFT_1791261 [Coprinellus micaceus]|uniref:Ubiquitin-like domain-containing protein n=1 Tax=Coprinellus micaceus TaxID=71717 RepID=A0A4Y7TEJ2_COPMI|nr:hypothetical protein FA13DRAFT_1791261 [Coprinellus micaceus]
MLALLNRTSRKAKFLFWTCPDIHLRLPWPRDEPLDKESTEDGQQTDFSTPLNLEVDATIASPALVEPLASAGKHPAVVELEEDHAPYEELLSQAERSSSSATGSTASCQTIQHFFAGASHFTVGQLNTYGMHPEELQEVRMQVQLLQAHIAQRGLSQPVGYNRENGVRIVDALGGELVLPPSIMGQYSVTSAAASRVSWLTSRKDVHELMMKHFRGKLGEKRVVRNRYCIMTERDGILVQPEDWDHVVSSGEGLIMCMVVEKILVESVKDTCPQCGKTRLGTYRESGWLICRRCEKRFQSSADSISRVYTPPNRGDKIASFRHIQKVFVEYVVADSPSRKWTHR